MTTKHGTGFAEKSGVGQPENDVASESLQADEEAQANASFPNAALEAILRQLVTLRAGTAVDDQLAQLIRLADSATWSVPIPMTILVDGAVLQGLLVPSEVSATFLDEALRRAAHNAVDELEQQEDQAGEEQPQGEIEDTPASLRLRQARTFLRRIKRRPFAVSQTRLRERNASALIAINKWHTDRVHETHLTPLDIPGSYADPTSDARDVVAYVAGQRAVTLASAKMLVGGEWLALSAPVRVAVGRISAWTLDL